MIFKSLIVGQLEVNCFILACEKTRKGVVIDPGGDAPAILDLVREDDRIDLIGLAGLEAGKPVSCILNHSDGTTHELDLQHSYGESQIEWFLAGSALNLFHK